MEPRRAARAIGTLAILIGCRDRSQPVTVVIEPVAAARAPVDAGGAPDAALDSSARTDRWVPGAPNYFDAPTTVTTEKTVTMWWSVTSGAATAADCPALVDFHFSERGVIEPNSDDVKLCSKKLADALLARRTPTARVTFWIHWNGDRSAAWYTLCDVEGVVTSVRAPRACQFPSGWDRSDGLGGLRRDSEVFQ